jgi:hypothetical protein
MSWETRGNPTYYYRARKINGRVVKEYLGTGASAEAAAAEDEARRLARQIASAYEKEDALASAMDSFLDLSDTLCKGSLVVSGYYRHHGGEWRRRHGN